MTQRLAHTALNSAASYFFHLAEFLSAMLFDDAEAFVTIDLCLWEMSDT